MGDFITFHVNPDLELKGAIPESQSPTLKIRMHQTLITAYDGDDWPLYRPEFAPEVWQVTKL